IYMLESLSYAPRSRLTQSPDGSGQAMERDKLLHFKTRNAPKPAGMNSRAIDDFFYLLVRPFRSGLQTHPLSPSLSQPKSGFDKEGERMVRFRYLNTLNDP